MLHRLITTAIKRGQIPRNGAIFHGRGKTRAGSVLSGRNKSSAFELTSSTTAADSLHFCIVGSGPAGFYTAERVQLYFPSLRFDRLPHPYGLVRTGVAPDHADTKNVINQFYKAGQHPNFSFFGNVTVGRDVSVADLQARYHAVILAYGAESHHKLEVPGQDLKGVLSAREFVEWYNGHPDAGDLPVDLSNTETVAICGLGNVAVDCARILLQDPARLEATDIAQHALDQLRSSSVRSVSLIGRRGVVQAAFTPKELKELVTLHNVNVEVDPADLQLDDQDQVELKKTRLKRRVHEIISNAATNSASPGAERSLHLEFKRSLASIHPSASQSVEGIDLQLNELIRDPSSGRVSARGTGSMVSLKCEMVLGSIGYRSVALPGVPFDSGRGIIPNSLGRVLANASDDSPPVVPGMYTVGWVKRGPTGIIGTNLVDAQQTVECIKEDIGSLPHLRAELIGAAGLEQLLQQRGCRAVSFPDWMQIDAQEIFHGQQAGKSREKFTTASAMLACL